MTPQAQDALLERCLQLERERDLAQRVANEHGDRALAAEARLVVLEQERAAVLDLVLGWTRPMSDQERLDAIEDLLAVSVADIPQEDTP